MPYVTPIRELACRKPRNGCRRWRVPESRNERVVESRNDCVAKSRKDRVVESRNDRAVKSWIPGPKGVMEPKGVTCGPLKGAARHCEEGGVVGAHPKERALEL